MITNTCELQYTRPHSPPKVRQYTFYSIHMHNSTHANKCSASQRKETITTTAAAPPKNKQERKKDRKKKRKSRYNGKEEWK